MTLHLTNDTMRDDARTACDQMVGPLLTETEDNMTTDPQEMQTAPDACRDCKDAVKDGDWKP